MKFLPEITDSHMSKGSLSTKNMVAAKPKSKVVSCSTPELQADSPSRDSDSVCDSEAASPIPFLCTQDGAEGETDVVWNYYTPKAEHTATSRIKNSTPLTRKRKASKPKLINRPMPKRKLVHKVSHKKTELFQELVELNQNLDELISKKKTNEVEDKHSGSEEDLFSDLSGQSPKSCFKTNSRCLRKNLLSSKFAKPEVDTALESDDSMNECLIKASQVIEENILKTTPAKKSRFEPNRSRGHKKSVNFEMDQDSMDAILNSIKLESPLVTRTKKSDSPCLNNDSFDNLVGNLNDSALDRLTQAPVKDNKSKLNNSKGMDWLVDDIVLHEDSMAKSFFGRHNSMPESPSVSHNKPSTSGMVITRYSSMPYDKNTELSDSPIRCTPDEIKRKHQQAREKLLAKRQLPFTTSQLSQVATKLQPVSQQKRTPISQMATQPQPALEQKKTQFQPRVASTAKITSNLQNSVTSSVIKIPPKVTNNVPSSLNKTNNAPNLSIQQNSNIQSLVNDKSKDLKVLIEKKRQEALMKLRRRQPQK
ncbi:uncharacterized protein [Choristoneura fumiferana]|uniref:uncharacterized protein n=1 Tax=Choristoneura fumiferana TaxID=7141 RepID=UPI003D155B5B